MSRWFPMRPLRTSSRTNTILHNYGRLHQHEDAACFVLWGTLFHFFLVHCFIWAIVDVILMYDLGHGVALSFCMWPFEGPSFISDNSFNSHFLFVSLQQNIAIWEFLAFSTRTRKRRWTKVWKRQKQVFLIN